MSNILLVFSVVFLSYVLFNLIKIAMGDDE
jgi:hypothetical protein